MKIKVDNLHISTKLSDRNVSKHQVLMIIIIIIFLICKNILDNWSMVSFLLFPTIIFFSFFFFFFAIVHPTCISKMENQNPDSVMKIFFASNPYYIWFFQFIF